MLLAQPLSNQAAPFPAHLSLEQTKPITSNPFPPNLFLSQAGTLVKNHNSGFLYQSPQTRPTSNSDPFPPNLLSRVSPKLYSSPYLPAPPPSSPNQTSSCPLDHPVSGITLLWDWCGSVISVRRHRRQHLSSPTCWSRQNLEGENVAGADGGGDSPIVTSSHIYIV